MLITEWQHNDRLYVKVEIEDSDKSLLNGGPYRPEVLFWLEENIGSAADNLRDLTIDLRFGYCSYPALSDILSYVYYFRNKDEATLFKLTWSGNV